MSDSVLKYILLAGVPLKLVYKLPFPVEGFGSSHSGFVSDVMTDGTGAPLGEIEIVASDSPPPVCGDILFSAPAWRLSKHGGEYTIVLTVPGAEEPLWVAQISEDFERAKVFCTRNMCSETEGGERRYRNPFVYPLDQIYSMLGLSLRSGFIVHAAGMSFRGSGTLFAGKSGAGKSTISTLLGSRKGMAFFSDDRIAVRKVEGRFVCYGTPWPGDAGIAVNAESPLHHIFFLAKSPSNRVEEIGVREAFERLLPVVSVPWYDPLVMNRVLGVLEELVNTVPAYILHVTPGQEAVETVESFLS